MTHYEKNSLPPASNVSCQRGRYNSVQIIKLVSWERDVLPAWRRASGNAKSPNSDIWGKLPIGVSWFFGYIEKADLQNLYVIGSGDWKKVFGTYRLLDVAADTSDEDDNYHHRKKIRGIQKSVSEGELFEPIIAVAHSKKGPFVIIDGNHRAVTYSKLGQLESQEIFLGLHQDIKEFSWYRLALQEESS